MDSGSAWPTRAEGLTPAAALVGLEPAGSKEAAKGSFARGSCATCCGAAAFTGCAGERPGLQRDHLQG